MPDRSAILVIDMANDFVFPTGVIADAGGAEYQQRAQAIIPHLSRLLASAREAGVLVVYTTDAHQPGDSELKKWPPHAMKGTWQAEIVPGLEPQGADLVLEKRTYSPFFSTDLEALLRSRGITRLYITGLHTDCCARHTSGDAFQKGFDLVWVTDALQAFTEEAHQAGLEYFKAWYATDPKRQFRTTDQLVEEWSEAGAPAVT
ncbi:MAG TPA: isochorismatase family cysteine hydrolase [Gemmatimonadales bacterium]|nr:isochorismatase family cysteine hydrolase [Gemmatimonadales bacterium]